MVSCPLIVPARWEYQIADWIAIVTAKDAPMKLFALDVSIMIRFRVFLSVASLRCWIAVADQRSERSPSKLHIGRSPFITSAIRHTEDSITKAV